LKNNEFALILNAKKVGIYWMEKEKKETNERKTKKEEVQQT